MIRITFLTGHLAKERHMLLFELAEDLSKYGAKVTVITGYPSRRISKEVRKYYLDHPIEIINDNLVVKRVGSKKGEGKRLLTRFFRYLSLVRAIRREALRTETDCFYIYSSPPFLGYCAKQLSKKAPVVYNAQDIFPDSLFAVKHFVKRTLFAKYFSKKEKQVYDNSSKIITITETMKKTISNRCDNSAKIDVVYNWSDFNNLKSIEKKDNFLFDKYSIPRDKFIVSYGGDIGLFQNWELVLDAAESIQNNKNIIFVIFGNGSRLENVKTEIIKRRLTNFYIFPMQPKEYVSNVYSLGDLEIVSLSKGLTAFALPSKLYNVFACKRPVLASLDENSEYYELIKKLNLGYSVNPDDVIGFKNAILDAYRSNKLDAIGKNGFNFLVDNCSRNAQTRKYYDIIVQCIKTYNFTNGDRKS